MLLMSGSRGTMVTLAGGDRAHQHRNRENGGGTMKPTGHPHS
jgi:hypothetical protein